MHFLFTKRPLASRSVNRPAPVYFRPIATRSDRRSWTPSLLSPTFWLDGSDISTMTLTTGVSQIRDKNGSGRSFSQSTTSSQPQIITTNWTSLPVLSFNGSTHTMLSSSNISEFISNSSYHVLSVLRVASTVGFGAGLGDGAKAVWSENGGFVGTTFRANTVQSYVWDGADKTVGTLYTDNTGAIITTGLSSGLNRIRLNGGTETTVASGNVGTSNNAAILGRSYNNNFLSFELGEIVFFSSALSEVNLQRVEGYLAWKWGLQGNLPAGHPFKNRSPSLSDR